MARVRSVEGTKATGLHEGWQVACAPPGQINDLDNADLAWTAAAVPTTAASALRKAGRFSLDDRVDFDQSDWWWRLRFSAADGPDCQRVLRFGGLATLADVWLNGAPILRSENMFVEHEVEVGELLRTSNDLVICFRSLSDALRARRPRPRWRTRMVPSTQLRWFRTTLLGRGPPWSPPAAPVGPWRPIVLEERARLNVLRADVRVRLEQEDGIVDAELVLQGIGAFVPEQVTLHVGPHCKPLVCAPGDRTGRVVAHGSMRIATVQPWWPHTHGSPAQHNVFAQVGGAPRSGRESGPPTGEQARVDLGRLGFRSIALDRAGNGFSLRVNGRELFCRGACWTPVDPLDLTGSPAEVQRTLEAVKRAGMNMVRVCGPFFYESDDFYDACDAMGILVWQDYSFANMDYPSDDPHFLGQIDREVEGFLDRTQLACSVAVLCGNSEVEQQAAMMGAPRESWRSPLFSTRLEMLSQARRPDVPYWPSTPAGGALPFFTDVGTSHYFGVGAYLRPLEDARRADVRFATECLAFANVPDDPILDALMGQAVAPQDPRWKSRTPRDAGTGWDFDDVRDHYLRVLFGVDPLAIRYADPSRYLALSRVVTGEVMANTFAEWRRDGSRCSGALVWFLRDLWPGAGWGVLDSQGCAKAAYHYLRRTLQPITVLLVDEGLNGLDAHVLNERPSAFQVELQVMLFRAEVPIAKGVAELDLQPYSSARIRTAGLFDQFHDTTYSYRFGRPQHDLCACILVDRGSGEALSHAYHFPLGLPSQQEPDVGLRTSAAPVPHGCWRVTLQTRLFAQSVFLDIPGFEPEDNYFHLAPGARRDLLVRPIGDRSRPQGEARPLNALARAKLVIED